MLKFIYLDKYYYNRNDGTVVELSSGHVQIIPNIERRALEYLIKRAGSIVIKDELIQAVWGYSSVTDESLSRCMYKIRKFFIANGKSFIRNVYGKGYVLRYTSIIDSSLVPSDDFSSFNCPLDCKYWNYNRS